MKNTLIILIDNKPAHTITLDPDSRKEINAANRELVKLDLGLSARIRYGCLQFFDHWYQRPLATYNVTRVNRPQDVIDLARSVSQS